MTELDLLKEYCDQAAAQRDQPRARARSRLLAAAAGDAAAGAARRRPRPYPRFAIPGTLVTVVTVTVTVAVVIAVAAGGLTTKGDGPLGQPASAAELLLRAAAAPAPAAPRPDQFIYVKSVSVGLFYTPQPVSFRPHSVIGATMRGRLARATDETWTSVNGTRDGLVRERPCEEPIVPWHNQLVPGDKFAACEFRVVAWGEEPGQAPTPDPPGTYGWEANLPTSRAGLIRYLEGLKADPGTSAEERIWSGIYNLFQDSSLLPARLRTAVYELAASLPGVRLIPDVADAAGRTGDAIALDVTGFRQELILQPGTYQLLGIQEIVLVPAANAECASQNPPLFKCAGVTPVPAGGVAESEAYLQIGVADSTPPLPAAGTVKLGS